MRRRLRRNLTCARAPNDFPDCPVVIHQNSSPHSAFPRHVTRKLDSVRGRAEIASGWPAAPAGSSQQVSDLVPIIRPGLCTRGCPRDGVPRSCMHMPHRVLGRPEFGSGGPTTLPGEALWVPRLAPMAGACFLGRKCPRDIALECMRHGGAGGAAEGTEASGAGVPAS